MNTPDEEEIASQIESHKRRSAGVLKKLEGLGVPLDAPRTVICNFWCTAQRDAAQLGKALYERTYIVLEMSRGVGPDGDPAWKLVVGITRSPRSAGGWEVMEMLIRLAIA